MEKPVRKNWFTVINKSGMGRAVGRYCHFMIMGGCLVVCDLDPSHYRPDPKDGEGNIFSLFTLAGGWGVPWPGLGGYPISGLRGGTPARSR